MRSSSGSSRGGWVSRSRRSTRACRCAEPGPGGHGPRPPPCAAWSGRPPRPGRSSSAWALAPTDPKEPAMSTVDRVVIVGGGLAGAKSAEALREQGYAGALTLVGAEHELPYQRPPLSKGYLAGTEPWEKALVLTREWYDAHDVELRLGVRAEGIDPAAHRVRLADGSSLDYDRLVLATGSTPRTLPLPGVTATGVHTLRDRADSEAIRALFGTGRRLVVIGAGWIGPEVAAAARAAGTDVTVVEAADLPLLRVLGPEIAQVFADLHREHGVDLRLGAEHPQQRQ